MTTKDLLLDAAARAIQYLDGVGERSVAATKHAVEDLGRFEETLPAHPSDARETLRLLDTFGSPATVATAGPRYYGFVIGGSLPASLAAHWLAGAWDQNAGMAAASPVSAHLERVALGWLLDVLGLPHDTAGAFVTGATMANFTGLAAARHSVLQSAGWDADADGLFGAPPVTVVMGTEAHTTLHKALGLLGLGRKRVAVVPADAQGRMRADAMPRISGPTIVCVQAGNVNTGAFDPADVIARAKDSGAWVHVDGAFGLWAAAAAARRHLMDGYARADSWATDAHKWLNVPYDSGLAFVRDAAALRAAFSIRAAYLVHATGVDPMDQTPESSRRARGIEVWAALRSLGRAGLDDLIERTCRHASRFAEGLRAAGYEILNDVVLNQVLVSFGTPDVTRRVVAGLQREGTCWCGSTEWQGRAAMRISVSSWATTGADVERSLEAMLRVARAEAVNP